jgi:hypothetical protein
LARAPLTARGEAGQITEGGPVDGGGGAAMPRPGRRLGAGVKTMPVSTRNSTGTTATMWGSMSAEAQRLKTQGVFAPSSFTFSASALEEDLLARVEIEKRLARWRGRRRSAG